MQLIDEIRNARIKLKSCETLGIKILFLSFRDIYRFLLSHVTSFLLGNILSC
jgi:hypothetical protein